MERLQQRITTSEKALQTFNEILQIEEPSLIERDASIQRFEYSFEAMWKLGKQYLRDIEGVDIGSPKSVIRTCRDVGLFSDEETVTALEMVDDRNLTSHTYNEGVAEEIYSKLRLYSPLLNKWHSTIKTKVSNLKKN